MNNKKGFTLIEVICAVALLSITMVTFVTLFTSSANISAEASSVVNSSTIAQSNIENNNGSVVTSKNISFTFDDGTTIAGTGNIVKSSEGNVDYSVVVADDSNFNSSGWSSDETISSDDNNDGDSSGGDTDDDNVSNYYTVNFINDYNGDLISSKKVKEGSAVVYPDHKEYNELTYIGNDGTDLSSVAKDIDVYYYYKEKPIITIYYYFNDSYGLYEEKLVDYNGVIDYSDLRSFSSYEISSVKQLKNNKNNKKTIELPLTEIKSDTTIYVYYDKEKPAACLVIPSNQSLYSSNGTYFYVEVSKYRENGWLYYYYDVYTYDEHTNSFILSDTYYSYTDLYWSDYNQYGYTENCN